MRILWSPQSLGDLDAIHAYIAKDSEHYAGLTISQVFTAVEQLTQFPRSGRCAGARCYAACSGDFYFWGMIRDENGISARRHS